MPGVDARVPAPDGRRRFLKVIVTGVAGAIGGGLAAVLGAFAARPATGGRAPRWVRAASLADLEPDSPQRVVAAVPKASGWHRTRIRYVVYVTWDGEQNVHALSATCSHLGCNVTWDRDAQQFRCPCHGGAYDPKGNVVAGPPRRPLRAIEARVQPAAGEAVLMVRL